MKAVIYTISMIVLLSVNSCVKSKQTEKETNVQYEIEHKSYDISKTILLENHDDVNVKKIIKLSVDLTLPLGGIDKLVVTEDRIFVLDRTFSRYLFIYDANGNLLFKIGDKGNGPSEYFDGPSDFYINEKTKQITIYESQSKLMYTYDWAGKIIKTRRLINTWPYSFAHVDSFFYYAYKTIDKDTYLLHVEDENEKVYLKHKKINKKRDVVRSNCFYVTSQNVYFIEDYNNDVVVLNDGKIQSILSFDFGENSISRDFLSKYNGEEFVKNALSNDKATNISRIVETDKIFAFQFRYKKMLYQIIQSKENGNYLCGLGFNSFVFPGHVYSSYGNELVAVLRAETLDRYLSLKMENNDAWNNLLLLAHPSIKKILLESKVGQTDDYVFIFDLRL
jgi:hypothetical protein